MSDTAELNSCGCCEDEQPEPALYNPPGQDSLDYRIGVHSSFLRRMVARLGRETLPDGDYAGERPLGELTSRSEDDFAVGLLDGWAVVGDVLTFYQERIANEGFLRTADERRSILELAREIGYELKPGVAAETYLAFTVDDSDATPDSAYVPAGTQVQSIPQKQDELPQTFETSDEFTAQVAWNVMFPRLTKPQPITSGTTSLTFEGINTKLKIGDRLLIMGQEKESDHLDDHWDVRRVLAVETEPEKDRTLVQVQAGSGGRPLPASPEVYAFRQRASIFGHNAADWPSLSNQIKADYLGLNSPSDLKPEDKVEWPNYDIYAPGNVLAEAVVATRSVAPTAEAVAYAAIEAAEAQAELLSSSAMAAGPATVLAAFDALGAVTRVLLDAGNQQLADTLSLFSGDYSPLQAIVGSIENIVSGLGLEPPDISFQKLTVPDSIDDFNPINLIKTLNTRLSTLATEVASNVTKLNISPTVLQENLSTIATQLNELRKASPGLLPFNILSRFQEVATTSQAGVADTMQAAGRLVNTTAGAGASGAIAKVVKGILENALQSDPTPEEVASLARFSTKLAAYASVLTTPQTLFSNVWEIINEAEADEDKVGLVIETLRDNPDQLILPADLQGLDDDEDKLALATVLGVAAAGAGGATLAVGSAAALGLTAAASTSYTLAAAPAVMGAAGAALVPLVVATAAMGPGMVSGATQIALTVDEAVTAALNPADELLEPRRAWYLPSSNKIDLDAAYDKIVPDSWLLLTTPTQEELFYVSDAVETSRAEFLISGKVTRVTLGGPSLTPFEDKVRETTVYAAPERLDLAELDETAPVSGLSVELQEVIEPVPSGPYLIISGHEEGSDEVTSELVTLKQADQLPDRTSLSFVSELKGSYQRGTVTIYGNVVHASHGETVAGEALGGGDGSQAHQRFSLKKPPLTHVSAETPSGSQSELTVRVNNVAWEQVGSLYGLDTKAKAFIVRIDDEANAAVIFGDGKMGARLPTGQENVSATYRSGIGQEGEVGAGTLTLLKTRPYGVRDVTNPLPADGAEDPETLDSARENAPYTVKTLDRIVSLKDYEDFARAFAGIGKSQAVAIWDGRQELVHITISDPSGDPVPDTTADKLSAAMESARDPLRQFCLGSFEALTFSLEAKVLIDEAYVREEVESAIADALLDAFSFDERAFGQPVSAAEVVTVFHSIAGVEAVDLDTLYLDGTTPAPASVLGARIATYDETSLEETVCGRVLPAQLLLINPDGITLKEMAP